jgi:hypothetical protein
VIARLVRPLVFVIAAIAVGRAGVALGSARAGERREPAPSSGAANREGLAQQALDSARVRRLLQAARGANTVMCELAATTVDGRSGWSSGSGGDFRAGGSDSLVGDVVEWAHDRQVDATAVPALRAALADPDWCVRRLAAPLLGRVRDGSAMQAMLAALAAPDGGVREMAALALGLADDARAVAPLIERLHDDAPRVRATAAWALGEIERREAVRPLIGALADSDALVRESAARALGEVEDAAAIPALTDLLKSDRVAAVRLAAARALGEIAG